MCFVSPLPGANGAVGPGLVLGPRSLPFASEPAEGSKAPAELRTRRNPQRSPRRMRPREREDLGVPLWNSAR